ncbi:MlaC/ttg2D family ABC transporter substrate-binding protein [Algihabitans albus]|uniref:MlaC/ttg2D family ABC transporter substrate-binding protein n=1 Tax=Algihabitans albus TaxID=2164067 RepID=UPI000E5D8F7F|nr:ABC transporter substrate-binding protein [Algihabitans albus]
MTAVIKRGLRQAGLAVFAAALMLAGPLGAPASAQAETPTEFLQEFSNTALTQLTGDDLSQAEREARFGTLLEEGFDVPAVSQFILARFWRSASEQERADFIEVFKDYLAQRFLPLFGGARDAELRFGGSQPLQGRDDLFEVPVTFSPPGGGEPVRTIWRVRGQSADFKILDVRAEGVSLAVTLRDEYSSVIRQQGSVTGLVQELRRLIDSGQVRPVNQQG